MYKVRYDAKCCNWSVYNCAVEFTEDVCTSSILCHYNKQSKVARMHFVVEKLLDASIPKQDKGTTLEVKISDGLCMFLFEVEHSTLLYLVDFRVQLFEICSSLLQGNGTVSYKFCCHASGF